MKLEGSRAIVTGAASGLGLATARALVAGGGKVAILDLEKSDGAGAAVDLGEAALFTPANVTSEDEVTAALDRAVEAFGGLDICVNCAGVGSVTKTVGKSGPFTYFISCLVVRSPSMSATLAWTDSRAQARIQPFQGRSVLRVRNECFV